MSEQTQPASSPAEVTDVFNGQNVSLQEFSKFRATGEVPERFKPTEQADAEPVDGDPNADQEDTEDSDDSAFTEDKQQEKKSKRRPDVEARFKQLTDELKQTRAKLDEALRPKETKADSSTAKPEQPQNYKEWRAGFKPTQWIEEYAKANPEASYEDANAAMADYLGDVRDQFREAAEKRESANKAFSTKVTEARQRYGDSFDQTVAPAALAISRDLGAESIVAKMLNESDYLSDVLFTLGGDESALRDFIQTAKENPGKAIRYVAALESDIAEELSKSSEDADDSDARNDKGQFTTKNPPAKKTNAPKPPALVGGSSSSAFDVSDESLSPEEWARKRTEDLKRRSA